VRRGLAQVQTLPSPGPGFIGEGHTAIHVIDAREFTHNDPFIILADDRLDLPPGRRAGGAHPHAGFEIVTFVVEGEARDRDEGLLRSGDVLWMTAGSGVVHTAPLRREPGIEARVYSGASGAVHAPSHTYLPMTMVDVQLAPNIVFEQELPGSYNGFLYPLQGDVLVDGAVTRRLAVGEIGWLEFGGAATTVRLTAGQDGARVMLYAGERQDVPIVTHGPFVGETRADLVRLSQTYLRGEMPRVSELTSTPSR